MEKPTEIVGFLFFYKLYALTPNPSLTRVVFLLKAKTEE